MQKRETTNEQRIKCSLTILLLQSNLTLLNNLQMLIPTPDTTKRSLRKVAVCKAHYGIGMN